MKICTKCGELKEEYHKQASNHDGLKNICKDCVSKHQKKMYKKREPRTCNQDSWEYRFYLKYGVKFTTYRDWLRKEYGISTGDMPKTMIKEYTLKCKNR